MAQPSQLLAAGCLREGAADSSGFRLPLSFYINLKRLCVGWLYVSFLVCCCRPPRLPSPGAARGPAPPLVEGAAGRGAAPGSPGGAVHEEVGRAGAPVLRRRQAASARPSGRCGPVEGLPELPPASDVGLLLLIEVSKVHGCPGMLEQKPRRTAGFRGERRTAPPQVAPPRPSPWRPGTAAHCVCARLGRSPSPLRPQPLLYSPRMAPCGRSAWAGSGLPGRRGSGRLTGVFLCVRVCAFASVYI